MGTGVSTRPCASAPLSLKASGFVHAFTELADALWGVPCVNGAGRTLALDIGLWGEAQHPGAQDGPDPENGGQHLAGQWRGAWGRVGGVGAVSQWSRQALPLSPEGPPFSSGVVSGSIWLRASSLILAPNSPKILSWLSLPGEWLQARRDECRLCWG